MPDEARLLAFHMAGQRVGWLLPEAARVHDMQGVGKRFLRLHGLRTARHDFRQPRVLDVAAVGDYAEQRVTFGARVQVVGLR